MAQIDVREIGEDELDTLVEIANTVDPKAYLTTDGFVDWRRQAEDMAWLLAERDGEAVGHAVVLVGWHSPPHLAIALLAVLSQHRGDGAGTALLRSVSTWAGERGARPSSRSRCVKTIRPASPGRSVAASARSAVTRSSSSI